VWGALETLEDITEQKMNEEGLRAANKKLNLLADTTRHDILNTLTVLSGSIDLIRDEISDLPASVYLQSIDKALDTIYRQILFTRDYQNLGVSAPIWQSLHAIIEKMVVSVLLLTLRCIRRMLIIPSVQMPCSLMSSQILLITLASWRYSY
jgi:signal transduction histidine kinase